MKGLITLIALPAMIGLSNAAHFSCAREVSQEKSILTEKLILTEDAQQKICAMYFDNVNGIIGAPLPDKEEEAQPITNDDESEEDNEGDNHPIWPRENPPRMWILRRSRPAHFPAGILP
ncbi:hypothetical protein Q7P36_004002 [Cladosporium allicinum]